MSTTAAIEVFVLEHESCGELEGASSPATAEGYRLFLTCACGAHLDSWIKMSEAPEALMRLVTD